MTEKQKKLVENYIRSKVKSMLKESDKLSTFYEVRNRRSIVAIYNDSNIATKIANLLNLHIDSEPDDIITNYFAAGEYEKDKYVVKKIHGKITN